MADASTPILRCSGLSRAVGKSILLDSVNLDVAPREFLVIAGPSGAGKTTLLRLIAGLDRPTAGTIEIAGRVVSSPRRVAAPASRGVGMVFEQAALWPHMNVTQHLSVVLRANHVGAEERRQRLARLFDQLRLTALRDRYPHELSAGERQRVALARSLVLSPRLLLLDEPLAHLDVPFAAEFASLLIELHARENLTTICVMHRPEGVNAAASRYVILEQGRIVESGRGEDVFRSPRTEFVAALARTMNRNQGTEGTKGTQETTKRSLHGG